MPQLKAELMEALAAPFDPSDVKQRSAGGGRMLDYISIDKTIQRLNEVLGALWSFSVEAWTVNPEGNGFMACVHGRIQIDGSKSADGLGASVQRDPDDAIKTALAEALKKAGHQLGIALYLWDEAERDKIEAARKELTGQTDGSTTGGLGSKAF